MKWVADKIQCQLLQSKAHREKILNSTFFFLDGFWIRYYNSGKRFCNEYGFENISNNKNTNTKFELFSHKSKKVKVKQK